MKKTYLLLAAALIVAVLALTGCSQAGFAQTEEYDAQVVLVNGACAQVTSDEWGLWNASNPVPDLKKGDKVRVILRYMGVYKGYLPLEILYVESK